MPPLNRRLRQVLHSVYALKPEVREAAITALIREALGMEQALRFYADEQNWYDGVPMREDRYGYATDEDCGFEARWALHLVDMSYGPYLKLSTEAVNALKQTVPDGDAGHRGDGSDEERLDTLDAYPVWQRLPDGRDGDGSQN